MNKYQMTGDEAGKELEGSTELLGIHAKVGTETAQLLCHIKGPTNPAEMAMLIAGTVTMIMAVIDVMKTVGGYNNSADAVDELLGQLSLRFLRQAFESQEPAPGVH